MEKQQAISLISVGQLLRKTWQVYKSRIKTFLGIMLMPFLANIVFLVLVAATGAAGWAGTQFLQISLGGAILLLFRFS